MPQPPTQSMTLGPGGLSQSGSAQGLHSQGSLSDAIGAGLPPSSLMQAQIGNGEQPWRVGLGLVPGNNRVTDWAPEWLVLRWRPPLPRGPAAGTRARVTGVGVGPLFQPQIDCDPANRHASPGHLSAQVSCSWVESQWQPLGRLINVMGSRPFPSLVVCLTMVSLPPAQSREGSSAGWGGSSEPVFCGFHTPSPTTGPNHVSLQQTAQSTLPTTSMSMSGSGHGSGPGYSHSGPASQSVPLQSQGAISNYVSRANINMQSNPGTTPLCPWPPPLAASQGAALVGTGPAGGGLGCSHDSFRGGSEGWWHAPPRAGRMG